MSPDAIGPTRSVAGSAGVPTYFGGIGEPATLAALDEAGLSVERAETVDEDEGARVVQLLRITAIKAAA